MFTWNASWGAEGLKWQGGKINDYISFNKSIHNIFVIYIEINIYCHCVYFLFYNRKLLVISYNWKLKGFNFSSVVSL